MKIEFRKKTGWTFLALATAVVLIVTDAHAVPVYNVTDLTALGGVGPMVEGINDSGKVVGFDYIYNSASGVFTTLSGRQGAQINNNGQITGLSSGGAFVSDPTISSFTALGTLPGGTYSRGWDINDNSQVVGTSDIPGRPFPLDRAFISNPVTNSITHLGTLGGSSSSASAVNNSGQVVGTSTTWFQLIPHAFVTNTRIDPVSGDVIPFGMTDLGTLNGEFDNSSASDINNVGQITGSSDAYGGATSAFIANKVLGRYVLTNLGSLYGNSAGAAINDNGQVVGSTWRSGRWFSRENEAGFLLDNGTMYDINNLIDLNDPLFGSFTFRYATDINSYGDIVGTTTAGHALLLTAQRSSGNSGGTRVPEPAPFVLFGFGLFVIGVRRLRNR